MTLPGTRRPGWTRRALRLAVTVMISTGTAWSQERDEACPAPTGRETTIPAAAAATDPAAGPAGNAGGQEIDRPRHEDRIAKHRARAAFLKALRSAPAGRQVHPFARIVREYRDVRSRAAPAWTPLGPTRILPGTVPDNSINRMGRVNTLAFDPQDPRTIWAGAAAGGLWRSNDSGQSWSVVTHDPALLAVSGIAVDRRDPRTLYVLTGDGNGGIFNVSALSSIGVMKSVDGGQTWRPTGLDWHDEAGIWGFDLAIDPDDSRTLVAVTSRGLFRTADAGESWRQAAEGNFRAFAFKPRSCCVAYAATTTAIYRSFDRGETWNRVFQPDWPSSVARSRIELAVSPASPTTLYAVAGDPSGLVGIYRSDDCGARFTLRSNAPNILGYSDQGSDADSLAFYALAIAASPRDPDVVHVGGISTWKSTDGGATWRITSFWNPLAQRRDDVLVPLYPYTHADVHWLGFHRIGPDRFALHLADDGGVFRSEDGGETWDDLSAGLRITQVFGVCGTPQDSGIVYFGAQDNGSSRLADGLGHPAANSDGGQCRIDPTDTRVVYVSKQRGRILKSIDGGRSFVSVTPPSPTPAGQQAPYVTPFILDPADPATIWSCYSDLWKSVDGGKIWTDLTNGRLGIGQCVQVDVAPSDPRYLYVAKARAVYRSDDGGRSWLTRIPALPAGAGPITDLTISAGDRLRAWVTVGGYAAGRKVFETTDGALSWKNVSGNLPDLPFYTVVHDGVYLYTGTDIGVFRGRRAEGTWTWEPFMEPPLIVQDLDLWRDEAGRARKLRAGTYAQGVWELELDAP